MGRISRLSGQICGRKAGDFGSGRDSSAKIFGLKRFIVMSSRIEPELAGMEFYSSVQFGRRRVVAN